MEELWHRLHEADRPARQMSSLIMIHWTKIDPWGAIRAAQATSQESVAWWAWGRCDPMTAFVACQKESPQFLDNLLRGIGQVDPDIAQALLAEHPDLANYNVIDGIADGLDDDDPLAAVEFARNHGWSGTDQINELIRADPDAAMAWLSEHRLQGYGLGNVFATLICEHPERANEFLDQLPTGQLRASLLQAQVAQIGREDPETALALIREQPGTILRNKLYAELVNHLSDHSQQLEVIKTSLDEVQANSLGSLSDSLSRFDKVLQSAVAVVPDETIAILERCEGTVASSFVTRWAHRNLVPAASWVAEQPASDSRDDYAKIISHRLAPQDWNRYSSGYSETNYKAALAWAGFITQEEQQIRSKERAVTNWVTNASEDAADYFSDLPTNHPDHQLYQTALEARSE
jgi:hypothetical protein